jgi:hypothetical protein
VAEARGGHPPGVRWVEQDGWEVPRRKLGTLCKVPGPLSWIEWPGLGGCAQGLFVYIPGSPGWVSGSSGRVPE